MRSASVANQRHHANRKVAHILHESPRVSGKAKRVRKGREDKHKKQAKSKHRDAHERKGKACSARCSQFRRVHCPPTAISPTSGRKKKNSRALGFLPRRENRVLPT